MKKFIPIIIISITFITSSCKAALSDTALQTAVSEAIRTSSAGQTDQNSEVQVNNELEEARDSLKDAQMELTDQAQLINELQLELDQIYPLLTPTITDVPTETPIPTLGSTKTPEPTATAEGGLPYNQKYVIASGEIPVYTFSERNKNGVPIMQKTDPVKKFKGGQKIIVDWHILLGDGGINFYLVEGPQFAGFYIKVDDVSDYTGP
jgi:hypothetical protein